MLNREDRRRSVRLLAGSILMSLVSPNALAADEVAGTVGELQAESDQYTPGVIDDQNDWLHTEGSKIVDAAGQTVWITGVNWFGFNTGTNTLDGLWSVNLEESLAGITARGFNTLRIPISTELLLQWKNGIYPRPNINESTNPNLRELNSLQVFDYFLAVCREMGLKIIMDVHSAKTDAMGHIAPLWYADSVSTKQFFDGWVWLAQRYRTDDTIIGFDLKNEPHGKVFDGPERSAIWDDSEDPNNWKGVAEELAREILAVHPQALILVEGVEAFPVAGANNGSRNQPDFHINWWGGNLRGVTDYPVNLGADQNKLVYSPHDYGPLVFRQPWFQKDFNKDTLYQDVWRDNWAYIAEKNIAPLLIGEWGGFLDGGDNEKWLTALRDFIVEKRIHHTFWCYNPNSGDTGGLVDYDFRTWDERKYALVRPALWQTADGKFIGLDHLRPLGSKDTGTSLGWVKKR